VSIQDKFDKVAEKFPSAGNIERVPTASSDLNDLFSKPDEDTKGIPLGKVMTTFGPEGVGKSTIHLEYCKSFCDAGYGAVYIDSEEGLTHDFIEDMGLGDYYNELFMYHKHVSDYEQLEEILQDYLEVGDEMGLIVIDSLKSITVPVDIEDGEEVTGGRVGHEAQYDSKILGGYKSHFAKNNITLALIEQLRTNIDTRYGNTREEVSAGKGVKFYTDLLVKLKQAKKYKDDDYNITQADINFTTIKNKTAPVGSTTVPIKYSQGFDPVLLILDKLSTYEDQIDWYEQSGAWYSVIDTETGEEVCKEQGRDAFEDWLSVEENQELVILQLKEDGFVE
jgi:RecA/RadA recombinase